VLQKRCYIKQTPTSLSHIPVMLMKFEIISVVLRQKEHDIRRKCTNFCLHYITLFTDFGNDRNKSELNSRESYEQIKWRALFCLRVSDKIEMLYFISLFIGFIVYNHILYFNSSSNVFVFVFRVGPAVTHRMYCSLPRHTVLTPL
jgi:hypothetical protein